MYLRACNHVEGPVRFGKKQAYACTQKGKTRVAVFSPLPSGQQGRMCDSPAVPGWAQKLELFKLQGQELLYVRIINNTPDDERVVEQALEVRWGVCKAMAESAITHPLDGAVLREPKGGLDIDEQGIDAWTEIGRFRFGQDRRKVVLAMKGWRIEPNKQPEEIEAEPMEAVTLETQGRVHAFERTPVRAVRVRFQGDKLAMTIAGQKIEWKQEWQSRTGVFGWGFLPPKGPELAKEAVVFFDPPLDASQAELSADVEQVRVLRDIREWPLFEESEDFGETERPY